MNAIDHSLQDGLNPHRLVKRCSQELIVARKVAINGDAGGVKDCSLSIRSQPNASTVCSQRFVCLGTQTLLFSDNTEV